MKKFLILLCSLLLVFSLAACDGLPEMDGSDTKKPTKAQAECAHDYCIAENFAASCVTNGYVKYVCSKCEHSYQVETPAVAHSYEEATCEKPRTCTLCRQKEGEALGHQYVSNICSRCGDVLPAEGYDGSAVTITFYHTMGSALESVLDYYIEEFNERYPNIRVVHMQVGSYDDVRDQILNEMAVGMSPNIAYCYPDHVALYNKVNGVVSLDDLIASTVEYTDAYGQKQIMGLTADQLDDFIDGFLQEGSMYGDGKTYSLPMSKSTEVLYYDQTFFETHGLSVPTTWDEMEALCEIIKQIDPDCIPLGYDSESNWFINMCAQYGSPYTSATGDHYLFNNATNRDFAARFQQWYRNGYVTTQEIYGGYTSNLFIAQSGTRCYMCIASSGGAAYQVPYRDGNGQYPFEVGVAMIPQVNPDEPKVVMQGPSLCLFQSENQQEVYASWLFMKFLVTNLDFQAEFSLCSGYMPVLESVVKHPVYAEFLAQGNGTDRITARVLKMTLQNMEAYFASPAFVGSSDARKVVGELLVSVLMSEVNGKTWIAELFEAAVNACLGLDAPEIERPTTDPYLENAGQYIYACYKDQDYVTAIDYELMGSVYIGDQIFAVVWSADTSAIGFTMGTDGFVKVQLPQDNYEEIYYTLTATICNEEGESVSVSFDRMIPCRSKPVVVETGTYLIMWYNYTFASAGEDNNYGYNPYTELSYVNGTITGYTVADIMTLVAVGDGFTLQDCYGRYIYLKGTYNSLNYSYDVPSEGHIWQMKVDDDGIYTIVNKMNGKILALHAAYGSWGAYADLDENKLCNLTVVAVDPTLPEEPEEPETVRPVVGVAYKLGMFQGNKNVMLYFTGVAKANYPWYMLSTTEISEAIDVYVEEVSGGMRLYFYVSGVKTYLDMHKDGTHYSLRLTTEPTAVYTWNTQYETFVTMVEDKECFIGTSGTYDTFSCNTMDKIASCFIVQLSLSQKPITLADQIAEANKLANKEFLSYESVINGVIVDDPIASTKQEGYYRFTVSDGTNTLLCYYVPVSGGVPRKGDAVTVVGRLTAYNGAAQFEETSSVAVLTTKYVIADGTYLLVVDGKGMSALAADKNYGYMPSVDIAVVAEGGYTNNEIITITNVDGGFTMQDVYGRYIYMSGTYNNFNVSTTMPAEGHIWTATATEGGFIITNVLKGKSLFYGDGGYTTFGAYADKSSVVSVIYVTANTTPDVPAEPEVPAGPSGEITHPVAGVAYKLALFQGNKNSMLYFTGVAKENYPWYMLSTTEVSEATDVYVEEVTGGWRLYFIIGGTKTYLDMHKDGTHYSLRLTTEPTAVYTWNAEYNTFVATVEGQACFIGTYNTYDTFSCNKAETIASCFVAHLFSVSDN